MDVQSPSPVRLRWLAVIVAFAFAFAPSACGRKESSSSATAKEGEAAAAPTAATGALSDGQRLVDGLTAEIEDLLGPIEKAGDDRVELKEIGERFRRATEAMRERGAELDKRLDEASRKELEAYAMAKWAPMAGRILAALQKARASAVDEIAPAEEVAEPAGAAPTQPGEPAAAAPSPRPAAAAPSAPAVR